MLGSSNNNRSLPKQALLQLIQLRIVAILCQLLTLLLVHYLFAINLPLSAMLGVVATSALVTAVSAWRQGLATPIGELEISLHIAIDACILAILLYFSGGYTNPFVSLFLVHIAIAASFLNLLHSVSITILTMLLYSLLVFFYQPLSPKPGATFDLFQLHLLGMWIGFLLSAGIIAFFVTLLARVARQRENTLAQAREKMLQNEHVVLMGTLSAGIAHEINTPLSSIRMLTDELAETNDYKAWVDEQLPILKQQTDTCMQRIRDFTTLADQSSASSNSKVSATVFAEELLRRWSAMRSEVSLTRRLDPQLHGVKVSHQPLTQVVINLLNNAADASLSNDKQQVDIEISASTSHLQICIDDYGSGFTESQRVQAGQLIRSNKKHGLGIGLVLSHATLELLGGSLLLQARDNGTRATVTVPINREQQ